MTLDNCIYHYLTTNDVNLLEDYLRAMPRNEDGKNELLDAIKNYNLLILYDTLFYNFADLLSADEFSDCLMKFVEAFDCDPKHIADISNKIDNLLNGFEESSYERDIEEMDIFSWEDADLIDGEKAMFTAMNENGELVECETILTFEHTGTQKTYMVYTDNSKDIDGNIRVFASIYEDNGTLAPIETNEEWDFIEKLLKDIQNTLNNK